MRIGVRWVLLAVVLLILGLAAYPVGQYFYARAHYRAALAALDRRDFRAADDHLAKCLRHWPTQPGVRLLAAQSARRQGDFAEAVRHLQVYKKNNGPKQPIELEYRLLSVQQGDVAEATQLAVFCHERPDEPEVPLVLEALINGVLKYLEPAFAAGFAPEGEAADHHANARRAVEQWARLRDGEADKTQELVWRGRLALALFDTARAREYLGEAVKRDPDHYEGRLHLAFCLAQTAPAESVEHLVALRERNPSDHRLRFALAAGYRGLGQFEEARGLLDELLAADPEFLPGLIQRGRLALDMKLPHEAESWLRKALKVAPEEPEVNVALASALQATGKADEARQHLAKAKRVEAERKRMKEEFERMQKGAPRK